MGIPVCASRPRHTPPHMQHHCPLHSLYLHLLPVTQCTQDNSQCQLMPLGAGVMRLNRYGESMTVALLWSAWIGHWQLESMSIYLIYVFWAGRVQAYRQYDCKTSQFYICSFTHCWQFIVYTGEIRLYIWLRDAAVMSITWLLSSAFPLLSLYKFIVIAQSVQVQSYIRRLSPKVKWCK